MKLKQLFCNHNYKLIAKRKSNYCSDYLMFSDSGMFDDYLYRCVKCQRTKIERKINESHPLYNNWEKIDTDEV